MADERPRPTDAELGILRVLWDNGPLSVRAVLKKLNEEKPTGYNNVLKAMQVMTDKGLVDRDANCKPQIYRPRDSQTKTQRQLLRHLLERAFGGSTKAMIIQALSTKKTSPEDMKEIEDLLKRPQGRTGDEK